MCTPQGLTKDPVVKQLYRLFYGFIPIEGEVLFVYEERQPRSF